jgi:hypothetical protein
MTRMRLIGRPVKIITKIDGHIVKDPVTGKPLHN